MVSERIELSLALSCIEILQRYIIYVKLTIGFRKKNITIFASKKGLETVRRGTTGQDNPRKKVPRPASKE